MWRMTDGVFPSRRRWTMLSTRWDKHIDTKRVVQAIIGAGKKIRDAFNPYPGRTVPRPRRQGRERLPRLRASPAAEGHVSAGVEMGDFEEYLWNRHAEERNRRLPRSIRT